MENSVFVPTREEFKEILSNTVDQILARRIPEIVRQANRKEYLTTKEFKELTGCSSRAQHYYRKKELIPYSQEGRKIFYKTTDVEKFMADRRVNAKGAED